MKSVWVVNEGDDYSIVVAVCSTKERADEIAKDGGYGDPQEYPLDQLPEWEIRNRREDEARLAWLRKAMRHDA